MPFISLIADLTGFIAIQFDHARHRRMLAATISLMVACSRSVGRRGYSRRVMKNIYGALATIRRYLRIRFNDMHGARHR